MITTTSKSRTQRLVFTGDPAVKVKADSLEAQRSSWTKRQVAAALADLPKDATELERAELEARCRAELEAVAVPRVWVPVEDCTTTEGATVAAVRGLSWLEDQESQALAADQQIMRVLERGLVSLDGNEKAAQDFLADPRAELVIPLYRAISDLTWGN
jgi:hypothetical protein